MPRGQRSGVARALVPSISVLMGHLSAIDCLKCVLKWCALLLALKMVVIILSNYPDYFPPNFRSEFFLGHEGHFFGVYSIAFFAHILSSRFALISASVFMQQELLRKFPLAHMRLGKIHLVCLLRVVVPSGLWMSAY